MTTKPLRLPLLVLSDFQQQVESVRKVSPYGESPHRSISSEFFFSTVWKNSVSLLPMGIGVNMVEADVRNKQGR